MTDADAFLAWMRVTNPNIVHIEDIGGGEWAMIERLIYHYTIKRGDLCDYVTGYTDRWCIETLNLAVMSFAEWKGRGFQGEPDNWHRHPHTGRRRIGGDPATEYVER